MTTLRTTTLLDNFEQAFLPLYTAADKRWRGFRYIAEKLLEKNRSIIVVETGSTRDASNIAGDGVASVLWDWIARETKGAAISIDIDPRAAEVTRRLCPNTRTITSDSVTALRGYLPQPIDLLYLDSYDYNPGDEINSAMHQVSELCAIWNRLPSGCLIASDDCLPPDAGKYAGCKVLLAALDINPELESYVTVWRKP